MKITLINVSSLLASDGSRLISALLKRADHKVKSVFLARSEPLEYESHELESLDEILKDSDLVMIAVYSNYAVRALQVTDFIHKKYPGMKVIWGGPHCISAPAFGLPHADGVCFSEGDQAVVDLVNKMETGIDYFNTPNMAFNVNGSQVMNEVLPPFSDLDRLPYYDYDLDDQFLLSRRLCQMTKEMFKERCAGYPYYVPIFYFLTSRGCPHECSFCNNCRYIAMYGRNKMRFHSVDRVIDELEHILNYFDFIGLVGFGDDDFFMRPKRQLEEFARKYKKKVGLPFGIAVSANTYTKKKMEILLDAGLKFIQMGVESASQRVLDDVYNRKVKVSRTRDVVHQIEPYHKTHGVELLLDFIIDNPYETRNDIIQTYRYLLDLPLNAKINLFVLAFFPGTPIYDRAVKDGIIRAFDAKAFRFYIKSPIKYQKNYEMFLVLLVRYLRRHLRLRKYVPRFVLLALGSRPVRNLASIMPKSFYSLLNRIVRVGA